MIMGFIIILGFIILDQVTKQLIAHYLPQNDYINIIKGFFRIYSHRNDGAAWGIFSGNKLFLYAVTVMSLFLFGYLYKSVDFTSKKLYSFGLSLMISGAIGNFLDRIFRGEVVDFLDFTIFKYDFPIFNVADICLTIGLILFSIDSLFLSKEN